MIFAMIAQLEPPKRYSPDEYLELEINSQIRHEYIDGEIIPMTGGLPNHNQILLNLAGALNFSLRQQPYRVFAADQRVWIPQKRIYTYPDIFVVQGEIQLQEGRRDTITNPTMIFEVLSESTRAYDKDGKFAAYRTLPSFQEYVLVDQYKFQVEHYYKIDLDKANSKKWSFLEYDSPDTVLSLATVSFELSLADLYNKVEFARDSAVGAE